MPLALSQREIRLLERAKRAGVPIDLAALKRKFNLTVSPITTHGVDTSILIRLGSAVTALAEKEGFHCELTGIVLFPIIASSDVYSRNDFVTHKRASKGYFVGQNIAFETWRRARAPRRLALVVQNFESSVHAIPDRHLSPANKTRLIALIDSAATKVGRELRAAS